VAEQAASTKAQSITPAPSADASAVSEDTLEISFDSFMGEVNAHDEWNADTLRTSLRVAIAAALPELVRQRDKLGEATRIFGDALQRVGHALGLYVGSDLTKDCVPAIDQLRTEVERLRGALRELLRLKTIKMAGQTYTVAEKELAWHNARAAVNAPAAIAETKEKGK
jgi:hypothetical protein